MESPEINDIPSAPSQPLDYRPYESQMVENRNQGSLMMDNEPQV